MCVEVCGSRLLISLADYGGYSVLIQHVTRFLYTRSEREKSLFLPTRIFHPLILFFNARLLQLPNNDDVFCTYVRAMVLFWTSTTEYKNCTAFERVTTVSEQKTIKPRSIHRIVPRRRAKQSSPIGVNTSGDCKSRRFSGNRLYGRICNIIWIPSISNCTDYNNFWFFITYAYNHGSLQSCSYKVTTTVLYRL